MECNLAQTAQQYFDKLMRDAGMDETTIATVASALAHEKVAGNANQLVKTATEDYNAQVGRVRALEGKVKEYGDWYGTANSEYQRMVSELEQARNGNGNGTAPTMDTSKFISKDELASTLAGYSKTQAEQYAKAIKMTAHLASSHVARFKEALDVEAIDQIANEKNVPLDVAYNLYIQPRVEASAASDLESRIKREREEAVKQYASQHRLPVDPSPSEVAPVYAARNRQNGGNPDIDAVLMETWADAGRA